MRLQPLAEVPVSSGIASLPKADLHLHQEERPQRHPGVVHNYRPAECFVERSAAMGSQPAR